MAFGTDAVQTFLRQPMGEENSLELLHPSTVNQVNLLIEYTNKARSANRSSI